MLHQTKFQSFAETTSPTQGPPRVAALRAELKRRGLDGFIVPRADEYQGEYVPPRADRLAYLTGFTGSAGCAIVLLVLGVNLLGNGLRETLDPRRADRR